jgi:uncharacterized protein
MLIRFIIFLVVIYLLYRIVKFFRQAKSVGLNDHHKFKITPTVGEDLVEDPVCHIYVPLSQAYKKEIAGKIYYFCSKECCEGYILEKNK